MIEKQSLYRIIVFITIIISPAFIQAQDIVNVRKSENKVIIEGNIYFIHVVKPGHTLYSISKAYNVREKDIALENPGVYSGLQIGQVLKIPTETISIEDEKPDYDSLKFIKHELKEGENVYQLSKTYNVPLSEIENANPELDYADIPIGEFIFIPRYALQKDEEEFYFHKVRRRETISGLSRLYKVERSDIRKCNPQIEISGLRPGQIVRIPKPQKFNEEDSLSIENLKDSLSNIEEIEKFRLEDYFTEMKSFNRNHLKIAFFIPFDYYEAPIPDSLLLEEEEDKKPDPEEERKKMMPKSVNFLEFFEGSILAIERLKLEGINVDLEYFDTRKSPTRVREILSNEFMADVDLIIGPFFSWNVEIVSEFSKENGVPFIVPFYENPELTKSNPFLFQMNPSYKMEYMAASKILAREFDKNFLFIYSADSLKMHEVDFFKSSFLGAMSNYTHEENIVLKELVYENAAKSNLSEDLAQALSKDKKNVVVIPESNEAFVSNLITQLYFQLKEFDIEVFGMPHFEVFENSEHQYYHDLNLRYLSPYYFSYSDSAINDFLIDYRNKYRSEPIHTTRKGCYYSFLGYDVSYFFIKSLSENGKRFVRNLKNTDTSEMLVPAKFFRQSNYGGFENHQLKLIQYKSDYSIEVRDVSNLPIERIEPRIPWHFGFDL